MINTSILIFTVNISKQLQNKNKKKLKIRKIRNRESLFHAKFTLTVNRESLFHAKIIYFFIRESKSLKFRVFFYLAKLSPRETFSP